MRKPNAHDVQRIVARHEEIHGFPSMLWSFDCMHWAWRYCLVGWKGQYTRGDYGYPTLMLEAVASYDTWIWHSYFGPAGSNNDINVLNQSDLFDDLLKDQLPPCNYTVNGASFTKGYNLIIQNGQLWLNHLKVPLTQSERNLKDPKSPQEKILNELSVYFKVNGQLIKIWQDNSILARFNLLCILVCSYTI
ncbi:uncharacterized protein [Rutidosis leptorrhynchoides]|uniref:uncharacterized protein n=1 Tax=Rutidosis leptorrhynchoides TaxID=125765 RepID=UPI003A99282D